MNAKKRKKISPSGYKKRSYRQSITTPEGLISNFVTVKETDLHILAPSGIEEDAYHSVHRYRNQLENYIKAHPDFITSLVPLKPDALAPPIVKDMLKSGADANVGPMAAVAGAIAEYVGRDLLNAGLDEVIVENGGDIFIKRNDDCVVAIFAGESPLSQKVGINVPAGSTPLGICTSSGTVGHSLSLGKSDSVTVLAGSTPLADAAATSIGNEVSVGKKKNINQALKFAGTIPGLLGVVIICGEQMGVWGVIELIGLEQETAGD